MPYILPHHRSAGVTRHPHDLGVSAAKSRGTGDRPGPQRVGAISSRIKPGPAHSPLHGIIDRVTRNRIRDQHVTSLHPAEKRPRPVATFSQPRLHHPHRVSHSTLPSPDTEDPAFALLIPLRVPHEHNHPARVETDVGQLKPGQLRPAQARSETQHDQRPIASACIRLRHASPSNQHQIISLKRHLAGGPLLALAPHSTKHLPGTAHIRDGRATPPMLKHNASDVTRGSRGPPPLLHQQPGAVKLHRLSSGGKRLSATIHAPTRKDTPVRRIALRRQRGTRHRTQSLTSSPQTSHINPQFE